ncbi:MAG: S24/S26 family peptidase [Anaerolineales bacterium]|nr:S24/S26 family peptidase [Anaerolineales bacterium]
MESINSTVLAAMLRESMQNGQKPNLTLTSNSMSPLLKSGDQVAIQSISNTQLQTGDIITIVDTRDTTQLLTHRYWGTSCDSENEHLITRGDRPLFFDPPISAEKIVGIVILRRRDGRILNLQDGKGQWLNQQLTRLAALELKWLTGINSVNSKNILAETAVSNQRAQAKQQKFSVKIMRRGFNLINIVLTTCVPFFVGEPSKSR